MNRLLLFATATRQHNFPLVNIILTQLIENSSSIFLLDSSVELHGLSLWNLDPSISPLSCGNGGFELLSKFG